MAKQIGSYDFKSAKLARDSIEVGGRNYARTNVDNGTSGTNNGVTFSVTGPSAVKINGTATATAAYGNTWFGGLTLEPGDYMLWLTNTNGGTIWFRLGTGSSNTHVYSTNGNHTRDNPYRFTVTTAATYQFGPVCAAGTFSNVETKFMLEKGTIPTEWSKAEEDVDAAIADGKIWYAECPTAADAVAKVATITPATTAFELKRGVMVNVYFSATNTGAVGSLTLNVNGTGAKPLRNYYNGGVSTLYTVSYLRAGSIITFRYDGTNWLSDLTVNSTYNMAQVSWNQPVIASSDTYIGTHIIIGDSGGYRNLAAGKTFDLGYPILYYATAASTTIASGLTANNHYLSINGVTFTTNGTITSGAANKTLYLKGTISGNVFTVAAAPFMTCTTPTSQDGYIYIPLGVMSSATAGRFTSSKDLYAYVDGAFRQVNPTDIVATQKVYYRSHVGGDVPVPTAWIEKNTDQYNTTVSGGNAGWSTKVTPIAATFNPTEAQKHLYLYTCEQRKRLDGTVKCTGRVSGSNTYALLDDSNTVIDGGKIITGSVTANQIAAGAVTAGKIAAGAITADKIAANAITIGMISDLEFGGTNLLLKSDAPSNWPRYVTNAYEIARIRFSIDRLETGKTYTLQIWGTVSRSDKSGTASFAPYWGGGSISLGAMTPNSTRNLWTLTFTVSTAMASGSENTNPWISIYNSPPVGGSGVTYSAAITKAKLEVGTIPSDWSAAPEDLDADVETAVAAKEAAETSATNAANSASTASSKATAASTSATNAANSASTASTKASEASTSATNAANSASTASSKATAASTSATNAANSASTASTKASEASTSATNAANSATAAAEVMGGYTILWNYENFSTANNGEGYICQIDPKTGTKTDADGWVKFNGAKRTITKQMINPNTIAPYNIPIYVVARLGTIASPSSSSTTAANAIVWYNSGWKYAALPTPSAVGGTWSWNDACDIVLGKFVETASEAAFTECEIYNPPWSSKQLTTNVITANSANNNANDAKKTATNYITADPTNGIKVHNAGDSTTFVQIVSGAIDFVRSGVSAMKMWLDGTVAKVRVGIESAGHSIFSPDGMEVFTDATTSVAKFGSEARIGEENTSHIKLDTTGVGIHSPTGALVSKFGYGTTQTTSTSTGTKPYFVVAEPYSDSSTTAWSSSESYAEGRVVSYNGTQYVCTTSNTNKVPSGTSSYWALLYGSYSFASGNKVIASGPNSHAEGVYTKALGSDSHAEGNSTMATMSYSHSEGVGTLANHYGAHAEGGYTKAQGQYSHAAGYHTVAQHYQTVIGKYNDPDASSSPKYAFIIGNGTTDDDLSNAFMVDWNGAVEANGVHLIGTNVPPTSSYPGFVFSDGTSAQYIRTTTNGLLPVSADSTNGKSTVGTASWPFANGYFKKINGVTPVLTDTHGSLSTDQLVFTVSMGSIGADTSVSKSASLTVPNGYSLGGIYYLSTDQGASCGIVGWAYSQGDFTVRVRNYTSSAKTVTVTAKFQYLKVT